MTMKKYILVIISWLAILPSFAQTQNVDKKYKWDVSGTSYIGASAIHRVSLQALTVEYNTLNAWGWGLNIGYMREDSRFNQPNIHGILATVGLTSKVLSHSSGFSLIPTMRFGVLHQWGGIGPDDSKTKFIRESSVALRYMITPSYYCSVEAQKIARAFSFKVIDIFFGIKAGILF